MEGNYYPLLKWILLPPLAGFLANGLAGKKFLGERAGGLLGSLAVFISFLFAALSFSDLLNLPAGHRLLRDTLCTWFSAGGFSADAAFRFDPLSAVMALLVTGVSLPIHIYSAGYLKGGDGYHRDFAYLNLAVFFMLVLVLADNPLVMFAGWAGVGLCSGLLAGFTGEDPEKAAAGKRALMTNRAGDAAFLLGLLALFALLAAAGAPAMDFAALEKNAPLLGAATALGMGAPALVCLLLFLGAAGKSAQFPLHAWLPEAAAASAPASALMNAVTATAGVYMLARFHFLCELAPRALDAVMLAGCFTAFFAAVIALPQRNINKTLAWSTVSQLGFMFMAAGAGAFSAAVFLLAAHAFFKALLFLGAGSVVRGLGGEQDLFKMGGLRKEMPYTFLLMAAGWLALAGAPGLSGFYSAGLILEKVLEHGGRWAWAAGIMTAGLTAFCATRLTMLAFLRRPGGGVRAQEQPLSMLLPMAALGIPALAAGFLLKDSLLFFLDPAAGGALPAPQAARLPFLFPAACLSGIAAAFTLTLPKAAAFLKPALAPAHKLAYNGFYIDELCALLVVRPLRLAAGRTLFTLTETGLIDGMLVNGPAKACREAARALRRLHNGRLDRYALAAALAAAAMLYWIL